MRLASRGVIQTSLMSWNERYFRPTGSFYSNRDHIGLAPGLRRVVEPLGLDCILSRGAEVIKLTEGYFVLSAFAGSDYGLIEVQQYRRVLFETPPITCFGNWLARGVAHLKLVENSPLLDVISRSTGIVSPDTFLMLIASLTSEPALTTSCSALISSAITGSPGRAHPDKVNASIITQQ